MRKLVALLLLLSSGALAQPGRMHPKLTGVLSNDLFAYKPQPTHQDTLSMMETTSALKAGVFSLLIPGSGQIYNGGTANYIKGAGFLALEAAAIAVDIIWTNKGNNQTTSFQNYADANYSPLRYAQWVKLNINTWDPNAATDGALNLVGKMFVNGGQQVDIATLNQVESILGQTSAGQFFSHQLAARGTQQYYEVIGKYPQFREGWNPNAETDNVNVTEEQLATNVPAMQEKDYSYMSQRHLANDYFAVSTTALGVVIANHFVSALEAAIWAHGNEKKVETNVGLSSLPNGLGYQTQVQVSVHF